MLKIHFKNLLDAVIGLPANLFYGTSIPACILVLKKCRPNDDNILFIDASNEFEKVGNQNTLTDDHVAKILETYGNRQAIEKYAYIAPMAEVAENGYNLNIPRYVDTFEEEEPIDLTTVAYKGINRTHEAVKHSRWGSTSVIWLTQTVWKASGLRLSVATTEHFTT